MQKTALCSWNAIAISLVRLTQKKPISDSLQLPWLLAKTCPAGLRGALLIMKLTIAFLLLGLLAASANGLSQTVTFSGKNTKLTKVFTAIEKQTGYTVFANKNLLKDTRPVSLSVTDMPLKEFLDAAFRDQPVDYEISNKTIFIKKRPASVVVSSLIDEKPAVKIGDCRFEVDRLMYEYNSRFICQFKIS